MIDQPDPDNPGVSIACVLGHICTDTQRIAAHLTCLDDLDDHLDDLEHQLVVLNKALGDLAKITALAALANTGSPEAHARLADYVNH